MEHLRSETLVAHHVGCNGRWLPAGPLDSHESAVFLPSRSSDPLKSDWQKHVLASSGYLELGMFDDAAQVLEEIEPEEKPATKSWAHALSSTWQPRNGIWPQRLAAIGKGSA
jgi:hypothetical protein